MKNHFRLFLILSLLLSFIGSLWVPSVTGAATQPTVTTKSTYTLMSGVTESACALTGGHNGYMLQIAPTAKASLKASYSKYFTANSTRASRSKNASSLGFSTMTTTAQAAAYETATDRNVIFTMNGNFFDTDTLRTRGYLVVEGTEIHPADSDCICYFAVLEDGSYDIRAYTEANHDVVEAVAGRQWLVKDGVQMTQNQTVLSARTAIGLKADGTVICFVVDEKTNSTGLTINDMCKIMFDLGCVEAINLDGGGSSTFVTQRTGSDRLQIRNQPSDSTGERPVVSTLMLVTDPESDHLYFDFTNNSPATKRYEADIYGGLNYDIGSWHYHHTYSTPPTFDHALGVMSFTTTPACPTTRNIHPLITSRDNSYTSGHPLSYVPVGNDYFKMRMKIEGSSDTEASFRLLYASDDSTSSSNNAFSCTIPAGAINNGYFVLEGYANFGGVDTVNAIRPEIFNLIVSDPKNSPVTFTFDYIYVGPKEGGGTGNALYFDFSNNPEARERYNTVSYGFLNYDAPTAPYWATNYNGSATAFTVDNTKGLLQVAVTDGYSGSLETGNLTYGPWIKTTNSYSHFTGRTTYSYFPLSYDPSCAEIIQLRFRTENCIAPEGTTPRAVLEYYYIDNDTHGYKNDIRETFSIDENFQTLTIPVSPSFHSADILKCFGFRFQNIMSSTAGTIFIDYIYIGPACNGPEPQHTHVYTPKDITGHLVGCQHCDLSLEEAHSYTEGKCICGQVEIKEPIEETTWKMGHTLNLASDISVSLAIGKSSLSGFDMDTVYVLAELDVYEGNTKIGVKTVKILPEEKGSYYYFTLDGLTAVKMNDRIRSVLYGTKDGQIYYSPVDDYSIADYAYSQMNKSAASATLKSLCADLLRYGAKAQIFKGYRTDDLADANMTEGQKAFLSDMDSVVFGNTNTVLGDLENAPMKWEGKALDLASKVTVKFIFSMGTYTGDIADLTLRVNYESINGITKTLTLTNGELYNTTYGLYAFTLDSLLAAELRSVLSVQIYEGKTPVSCTLQYAADTYGNNKTGTLGDLCKALFAYADSAKAYFVT